MRKISRFLFILVVSLLLQNFIPLDVESAKRKPKEEETYLSEMLKLEGLLSGVMIDLEEGETKKAINLVKEFLNQYKKVA